MKKLKKINLNLDKEVISFLSGDEMNLAKGGTEQVTAPDTSANPLLCPNSTVMFSNCDKVCSIGCIALSETCPQASYCLFCVGSVEICATNSLCPQPIETIIGC